MGTTKQGQRFVTKAIELLRSLGAEEVKDSAYDFTLETKAGRLWVRPTEVTTKGIGIVFCRFADPQRAIALLGPCPNPHSGKWNHMYFEEWTLETALADFTFQMEKITLTNEEGQRP